MGLDGPVPTDICRCKTIRASADSQRRQEEEEDGEKNSTVCNGTVRYSLFQASIIVSCETKAGTGGNVG